LGPEISEPNQLWRMTHMTTSYAASNSLPMSALPTASGILQRFPANATNAGASTYAPDGLAASPIFGLGAQPLQGSEIVSGGNVTLVSYIGPLLNSGALCWVLLDCDGGTQQVGSGVGSQQAATVGQVQEGALITAIAGGTANALTATIASTLTSLANGQPLNLIASAVNTGPVTATITLGATPLASLPIVKGNNQALIGGDIPAAGYPIELNFSSTFGALVMQNPATGVRQPVGVVGSTRNLKASVAVAGTSVTYAADQIVVVTALNGTPYLLASFSETFNGSTTGLGGMDTGALPASSFVAIYAALTSTGAQGIFGTVASSLVGQVYGGAHLPAGVTATALIGVWRTDATGNLIVSKQRDRRYSFPAINIFSTTAVPSPGEFVSFSVASLIPPNAVSVGGLLSINNSIADSSMALSLASDASGTDNQSVTGFITLDSANTCNFEMDFGTAQTLFYNATNETGTALLNALATSYSI
jgi:hypothetical protein